MKLLAAAAAFLLVGAGQPGQLTPAERAQIDEAARVSGVVDVEEDPPRDEAHPARNRQLVIPSGPVDPALGRPAEMNALFFQTAGPGPHPTMLLLHGLPGNERNLDLAQAVRRAGWNVLTFTYRGAWGSEGRFSIANAVEDTGAALRFLRLQRNVRDYGIDTSRIVIAGHSMGGYMAAHWAAADRRRPPPGLIDGPAPLPGDELLRFAPYLRGVILLDAWDIGADARQLQAAGAQGRAAFLRELDDVGHALGPITAADLYDELMRRGTQWDLAALAPQLNHIHMLTIYATHGGAEQNKALADAITRACPPTDTLTCEPLRTVELNTDHAFADSRMALAREVVGWLEGLARD